jgi:hypothetical protein
MIKLYRSIPGYGRGAIDWGRVMVMHKSMGGIENQEMNAVLTSRWMKDQNGIGTENTIMFLQFRPLIQ